MSRESGNTPTQTHLQRALDVLRADAPRRYAAIASALRRSPAKYQIGAERFTLSATDGEVTVDAGWRMLGSEAEVTIPPRALVDVIDGTTTLERLIAKDVLRIAADRRALLALDQAARHLARAGIASARLRAEYDSYRDWVFGQAKERERERETDRAETNR